MKLFLIIGNFLKILFKSILSKLKISYELFKSITFTKSLNNPQYIKDITPKIINIS